MSDAIHLLCCLPLLVPFPAFADEMIPAGCPPAAGREDEEGKKPPHPIVADSLKAHVDHLLAFLRNRRREKKSTVDLPLVLQSSFSFAQARSKKSSPVQENAAALVALGIVVGDPRFGAVVGFHPPQATRQEIRRQGRIVQLRGRRDLARHFCLSAALSAIANESLSNLIGRFKEQADAVGGSGFSFVDLMADQAGSRLGEKATKDKDSALRTQRALAKKPKVEDYMPTIKGLPEGLSAERLKMEYGGVGGAGYQALQEEIDRRLDQCPLFKGSDEKEPS